MKLADQELLTQSIELKAGILKIKIDKKEVENSESNQELLAIYEDSKINGISNVEAKALLEDLELAIA